MSKEPKRFKQTEIGELPEEWEVVRAEEDFEIIIGKTPSRNQSKYWDKSNETDNFWATIEDLKERFITTTKERVSDEGIKVARMRRVPEGTVLVSFKLTIGRVAIAGRPLYFNEAIAAFLPKSNCRFNRDFLFYALHLLPLWAEQQNLIDQAVKGVTLNKKKLQRLLLPLPPLEEQKRIAGVLRLVDKIAEETKRIINIYEKAKKFALKHLLTRGIGHTRFKQTEIGELPEEWEVKPLSETLLDHQSGEWGKDMKEFNPNLHEPMRIVRSTEFTKNCHLLFETAVERAIPKKKVEKILLKEGDILVERSGGGPKQPVGRVVFVERLPEGNWGFSNFIQRLRVKFEYHPRYIWAVLYWHWLRGSVLAMQEQTTGIRNLRWSDYLNLPIPLPPLEEQKQIAEMLSTIDAAIENERKYLRVLEKCKKWLLDNLLTGKVRLPPEVDEILKEVLPDAL